MWNPEKGGHGSVQTTSKKEKSWGRGEISKGNRRMNMAKVHYGNV
jgi:hypothetical protein